MVAVRWYLRYGLSYRDVEELLAERGIDVDHVTVYRWVHRFTLLLADAARFARHSPGDRVTPAPSSRASRADPRRPGAPSVKAVLTRRELAGGPLPRWRVEGDGMALRAQSVCSICSGAAGSKAVAV
nr:hypothetical protein GCM10020092_081260 [Actinoplanes digitatis]